MAKEVVKTQNIAKNMVKLSHDTLTFPLPPHVTFDETDLHKAKFNGTNYNCKYVNKHRKHKVNMRINKTFFIESSSMLCDSS